MGLPDPAITDLQNRDNLSYLDRQISSVQAAARKRLTEAEGRLDTLEDTPTWTAPTLLNSWVNFGSGGNSVGYWKDPSGIVHLRGLVKSGTPSSTSVIFVLPADHRPAGDNHHFAVASNAAFGFCRVDTDGDVIAFSGSGTWFSLDGITFSTT